MDVYVALMNDVSFLFGADCWWLPTLLCSSSSTSNSRHGYS